MTQQPRCLYCNVELINPDPSRYFFMFRCTDCQFLQDFEQKDIFRHPFDCLNLVKRRIENKELCQRELKNRNIMQALAESWNDETICIATSETYMNEENQECVDVRFLDAYEMFEFMSLFNRLAVMHFELPLLHMPEAEEPSTNDDVRDAS